MTAHASELQTMKSTLKLQSKMPNTRGTRELIMFSIWPNPSKPNQNTPRGTPRIVQATKLATIITTSTTIRIGVRLYRSKMRFMYLSPSTPARCKEGNGMGLGGL